jgi:hypothetical protein
MSKYHLEHPTQATACGTSSATTVLTPAEFDHAPDGLACKACKRTLDASRAGRKAYRSWLEDYARKFAESEKDRRAEIAALLARGGRVLYEDHDSIFVQRPPTTSNPNSTKESP